MDSADIGGKDLRRDRMSLRRRQYRNWATS